MPQALNDAASSRMRWNNTAAVQGDDLNRECLMKIRELMICACLLAAAPAIANDHPPSDVSIDQLLTLTNARQLLDQMKVQVDSMIAAGMQTAQQGQSPTPERQAVLDRMKAKMTAVLSEMLTWESLEPIYIRTYRASLTQDELDGMIAFYASAPGQAYIHKMPVIMQNVMLEMQGMLKPMQQRLAEIQKQAIQEMKDLKASEDVSAKSHGGSTS
jgi:uncharacterized protein